MRDSGSIESENPGVWRVRFPLTPALSLGERGNGAQRLLLPSAPWLTENWLTMLPLPGGEGRGEGEATGLKPLTAGTKRKETA